jgi:ferredoxin
MTTTRLLFEFPGAIVEKPITYHLIRDYGIKVNILRAEVNPGKAGRLLVEVEAGEKELDVALAFVEAEGVRVTPLEQKVVIDRERCVDCGACAGVCLPGALRLDADWRLAFDARRCVACALCARCCPLRAIEVIF